MAEIDDLVRAFSKGYLSAGGEHLPATGEAVEALLEQYDVETEEDARALGMERANDEAEGGSDDPLAGS